MTLDDAAAILDVTEKHVVRLIREGTLRGVRVRINSGPWGPWKIKGDSVRKRRSVLRRKGR